jgi:proline racemase/trans-L-3-hydroxyproline dehydratase
VTEDRDPAGHGIVRTVDYHTGGEPFRIVVEGAPELEGRTVLERRRWAIANLDAIRHLVVDEPRGHADMYGCFVTPPNDAGAELGVVFFHNEGYSTACGHGTIALVTWAIDVGRVAATRPETRVVVDVPSGRLRCRARLDPDGRVASVAFRNVPAFVLARDVEIGTSRGPVGIDVAFGGAFYGSVDVRSLGLDVSRASLPALIALQRELRPALDARLDPRHPGEPELGGIYGVIFWQPEPDAPGAGLAQRNVTVFADGEVDRSPCGSGTSARLALLGGRRAARARRHARPSLDRGFGLHRPGGRRWAGHRWRAQRDHRGGGLGLPNRQPRLRARSARSPRNRFSPPLTPPRSGPHLR